METEIGFKSTAEVPTINMYRNEIMPFEKLPISFVVILPLFAQKQEALVEIQEGLFCSPI